MTAKKREIAEETVASKSFEQSMEELDSIVVQMENGNLPLEQMIDAYRRGAGLVRHCREQLTAAQMEIKKLEKEELIPFDYGDNE